MSELILVADDEKKIVDLLRGYLEAEGYRVVSAGDGARALELFRKENPDCLVLDIGMPALNGLDLARAVRRESDVPIIFLSARADETDRVAGLELGADDYVVKPFSPRELLARVRARLRRPSVPSSPLGSIRSGDIVIDPVKRSVLRGGIPVSLTAAQFDILFFLAGSPGRVFSRLEILSGASQEDFEGYERTIDAQIKNLRRALGDDAADPRYIETLRGVGYRFREAAE
jgi:two-component system, OmpR family, alkaline phosphatase synthesis response regulator PhoP